MSLRVKKYFMLTYFSSPAMTGLAPCSNGRRIATPMLCSRPAPSIAACMIPGPAPVTMIQPRSASAFAMRRACSYTGSSVRVRAEPKTVALGICSYGANTANASRISVIAAAAIFKSSGSGPSVSRPRALSTSSMAIAWVARWVEPSDQLARQLLDVVGDGRQFVVERGLSRHAARPTWRRAR